MSAFLDLAGLNHVVIDCRQPFRASDVCIACLHADGRLELLTGGWEALLGYPAEELNGLPVESVLEERSMLDRLLDRAVPDPVFINVRLKSGARRTLGVHRRFDPYEPSLYLACEPFEDKGPPTSRASSAMSFLSSA
jgi:PAS domain-containing protein